MIVSRSLCFSYHDNKKDRLYLCTYSLSFRLFLIQKWFRNMYFENKQLLYANQASFERYHMYLLLLELNSFRYKSG